MQGARRLSQLEQNNTRPSHNVKQARRPVTNPLSSISSWGSELLMYLVHLSTERYVVVYATYKICKRQLFLLVGLAKVKVVVDDPC